MKKTTRVYAAAGFLLALALLLGQILGLTADGWFTTIHYRYTSQGLPVPPITRLVQGLHTPFASSLSDSLNCVWLCFLLISLARQSRKTGSPSEATAMLCWALANCLSVLCVGLAFWAAALLVLIPAAHPAGVAMGEPVLWRPFAFRIQVADWVLALLCVACLVRIVRSRRIARGTSGTPSYGPGPA